MKTHIINRFIAITAVAWLGQASAETDVSHRHSDLNNDASSPTAQPNPQVAVTPTSGPQRGVITLHSKNNRT